MNHSSIFASLAKVFQIPTRFAGSSQLTASLRPTPARTPRVQQSSGFSSTAWLGKRQRQTTKTRERRITAIRWSLYHPVRHLPRPLRFSRMRALRHWTIHRAWQLWQRQQRDSHQLQLERQWESMRAATEELRIGVGDGGKLYRKAISRKGVYGGRSDVGKGGIKPGREVGDAGRVEKGREAGIPIEYTRGLVDTPGKEGWDHAWVRGG